MDGVFDGRTYWIAIRAPLTLVMMHVPQLGFSAISRTMRGKPMGLVMSFSRTNSSVEFWSVVDGIRVIVYESSTASTIGGTAEKKGGMDGCPVVGAFVGLAMAIAVGAADGSAVVGRSEGTFVGLAVGAADGMAVVGRLEGAFVGLAVTGYEVGRAVVGTAVVGRAVVGTAVVGRAVVGISVDGVEVGDGDGIAVGRCVGAFVGRAVVGLVLGRSVLGTHVKELADIIT